MSVVYQEKLVAVDQLLLDPNNFRFQAERDFVTADSNRFAEPNVQERATKRIRSEGLQELKASILSNGFLPVERLVVRHYGEREGVPLYLVLEGNRRAASLKWIRQDHDAGVPVPPSVLATLDAVPVVEIDAGAGEVTYLSMMGIRHVGGIKQWGGYQRAKLVADLRDAHQLETAEIADRLGMTKHEVNRRYRAFRALAQMEEDEDFGDFATPTMYPLFHEAVSLPAVKDWLEWNDSGMRFEAESSLKAFYQLLTPIHDSTDAENGTQSEAKITSYSQVRDLREILLNVEARKVLLDPSRTFGDALGITKADELSDAWRTEVAEASSALRQIGVFDLETLTAEDLASLTTLRELIGKLLDTHTRLTATP